MCGILGTIPNTNKNHFAQALDTLTHRGPDDFGVYHDECISLGHRRLSIIDLSHNAKQPMAYKSCRGGGQYYIVFNGEIYNFLELRQELIAKGYIFHTDSDTEVILASFDAWGEQCLNRFNGMWALAIWDCQKRRLFLSRDRFGKKPLFYAFTKDKNNQDIFVFASEMKAIYPYLREVRPASDFSTMTKIENIFDYEGSEHTLIEGIKRFPHSHFAYYEPYTKTQTPPKTLQVKRYYSILNHLITPLPSYTQAVERFRELFLDSVKMRMRSDVAIGTALSGGLDSSSTMCAMAYLHNQGAKSNPKESNLQESNARESKDWQHAFIACFKDTPLDESKYASQVVDFLGIKATFLEINPLKFWDKIEHYFYMFEDVYITSPIPMIATYEAVKQNGVSVTLDGHGADELFSGYGHIIEALWDARFRPKKALDILHTLNQTRAQPCPNKALYKEGAKFLLKTFIKKTTGYKLKLPQTHTHRHFDTLDHFSAQLYEIFYQTILPTLLRNYDRYSMINGVEIRMPFMDHRLVEFVFSLPFDYKIRGGYTKRLIRDSVDSFMPKGVTWRKSKIGFNSPFMQWLERDKAHNGLKEWALDLVHSRDFLECELVENPTKTAKQIEQICAGAYNANDIGGQIWCELNPYLWQKSLKNAVKFA